MGGGPVHGLTTSQRAGERHEVHPAVGDGVGGEVVIHVDELEDPRWQPGGRLRGPP